MEKPHEFESREALLSAAKKEAIVCGDAVQEKDGGETIEIFNWHANGVRWKGVVVGDKEKPFSGVGSSEECSRSKRPYSDDFYKETGVMRDDE